MLLLTELSLLLAAAELHSLCCSQRDTLLTWWSLLCTYAARAGQRGSAAIAGVLPAAGRRPGRGAALGRGGRRHYCQPASGNTRAAGAPVCLVPLESCCAVLCPLQGAMPGCVFPAFGCGPALGRCCSAIIASLQATARACAASNRRCRAASWATTAACQRMQTPPATAAAISFEPARSQARAAGAQ